jgi:hypothetical protein
MELQSRPDCEQVLRRFEAWWHCAIVDRPPVTVDVRPERPPKLPVSSHATLRDRWLDVEYNVACFEAGLDGAVFLAEKLPIFFPNLGPDVCAAAFGCELSFAEDTSWSHPVVQSCRDILRLKPDLDGVYWRTIRELTDLSLARGDGRWITALTDLHTNGDIVAALRGPQALCLDFVRDLEGVRAAVEHVTQYYAALYDDLWRRIAARGQPTTTWLSALHAGRMYVPNCDFICMISPAMFQRAILPSLVWEMRFLERTIFHLDGPNALPHLETLLSLKELNALQWVYGSGNGPAARWVDVYRQAQAAGKAIQLLCEDIADALAVAEHLKPEGVWFVPGGQYSRDEAKEFIGRVARWAARGGGKP